jgi:hypothetical protein
MAKRRWYGRPNKPPENWHTPDKPAVRPVTGWLEQADKGVVPSSDLARLAVAVTLTTENWITILRMLTQFGETRRHNAEWTAWRERIRHHVLDHVNPDGSKSKRVTISLGVPHWRSIYIQVRSVCRKHGGDWERWSDWLGRALADQIEDGK